MRFLSANLYWRFAGAKVRRISDMTKNNLPLPAKTPAEASGCNEVLRVIWLLLAS